MRDQFGGHSALREPVVVITSHGGIYRMTLPTGFVMVHHSADESQNNYIESHLPGSTVKICYEQTSSSLFPEDQIELEKLFAEVLQKDSPSRRLNLMGETTDGIDAGAAYGALCQCFVFGGRLVPDGSCVDESKTVYEIRRVGEGDNDRNVLFARMQFQNFDGSRIRRQALLIMPVPPGEGGCGYVWLEGTAQEVSSFEAEFMDAIADGEFSQILPWG